MTSVVCAKTKVAPVKKLTIPRLELTASLMLAKLMKYVQANLKVNVNNVFLWTDSQVTHTWIKAQPARWKDYVRNSVTQIHELTTHAQWRSVPGISNPADCASRGLTTSKLEHHQLWCRGPPWLSQPSDTWPKTSNRMVPSAAIEERPGISHVLTTQKLKYHWDLIYRYSCLNKLLTVTSACFSFVSRLRQRLSPVVVSSHPVADREKARILWIKAMQFAFFSSELKTLMADQRLPKYPAFSRLTAFIDQQGIIRVGGRLSNAPLDCESKHPAILPRHSRFTDLVVNAAHQSTLHGGTQLPLSHVWQRYWIIGGRATVKAHMLRCVVCARQRRIRTHQLRGQLPLSRVTPSPPFSHTGIDYAGPLTLKAWKGRGAKTQKGWVCVFVCFSTSAVNIQLVTDYLTDGFIAAYWRFTSRLVYSDCGTNFVGADSALKNTFKQCTRSSTPC